jgi:hypothetical protein
MFLLRGYICIFVWVLSKIDENGQNYLFEKLVKSMELIEKNLESQ